MKTEFSKMHGLGNDFIVFDAVRQTIRLTPSRVRQLADRRFGIGCDQVLLVEPARHPGSDFYYRIFNADGGEVEQCGNGARCFAHFVRMHGLTDKSEITVDTRAGTLTLRVEDDGQITVNMGAPRFEPAAIPFLADAAAPSYVLKVDDEQVELGAVSMGNPHAVLQVQDVARAPLGVLGRAIQTHPRFPRQVNVGFMQIRARDAIRLRVLERGVGETLACGSGACAAVAVGRQQGLLDDKVAVELPGGTLLIRWAGGNSPVWMTGPVTEVFEGRIDL